MHQVHQNPDLKLIGPTDAIKASICLIFDSIFLSIK